MVLYSRVNCFIHQNCSLAKLLKLLTLVFAARLAMSAINRFLVLLKSTGDYCRIARWFSKWSLSKLPYSWILVSVTIKCYGLI